MKRKYKCIKHKSNDGFYDSEGKWHCWFCYFENVYFNPNGIVMKELEVKKYLLRIVDYSEDNEKSMQVQVFDKTDKTLVHVYDCRDLSVAIRHFDDIIQRIISGTFKKSTHRVLRDILSEGIEGRSISEVHHISELYEITTSSNYESSSSSTD